LQSMAALQALLPSRPLHEDGQCMGGGGDGVGGGGSPLPGPAASLHLSFVLLHLQPMAALQALLPSRPLHEDGPSMGGGGDGVGGGGSPLPGPAASLHLSFFLLHLQPTAALQALLPSRPLHEDGQCMGGGGDGGSGGLRLRTYPKSWKDRRAVRSIEKRARPASAFLLRECRAGVGGVACGFWCANGAPFGKLSRFRDGRPSRTFVTRCMGRKKHTHMKILFAGVA